MFTITQKQQKQINDWYESLIPEIMAKQTVKDPLEELIPYYGAIGGGLTYSFTPTGLGTILIVKESTTQKEINVTDFENW